jgi:hypothetical protein
VFSFDFNYMIVSLHIPGHKLLERSLSFFVPISHSFVPKKKKNGEVK